MNKVQKIMSVMVLVVAIVLPTKAQISGQMSTPVIAFRSTSMMAGSGSAYSSSPMLTENGLATYSGAPSGPRREGAGTPGKPTTPGAGEKENQFPLGDGVLPMMLLLGAYCGFVALRRRKHVKMVSLQETLNG